MWVLLVPHKAMNDLLETSKALLKAVDAMPDNEWDSTSAYCATELAQLSRAIQLTEEASGEV